MSGRFGSTRVTCACCQADDPEHEKWCPFPEVDALAAEDLETAAVAAVVEMAGHRNSTRPWWVAYCRADAIGMRLRESAEAAA